MGADADSLWILSAKTNECSHEPHEERAPPRLTTEQVIQATAAETIAQSRGSILPNSPAGPPDHPETAGNRKSRAANEEGSHAGQLRQSDGLVPGLDSSPIADENPLGKCGLNSRVLINSQKVGVKRQQSAAHFHFRKFQPHDKGASLFFHSFFTLSECF